MGGAYVVAMTGASGAGYGVRLLEVMLAAGCRVHLCVSDAAVKVIRQELNRRLTLDDFRPGDLWGPDGGPPEAARQRLVYHHFRDVTAPIASGSFLTQGMVVCPCSGGTLGAIAQGTLANLIHRAAEVHLKERRKLVLVTRETPLSLIQIENMLRVTQAGAVVLPASPGFYHGARRIEDLVDFVVARVCDQIGVPHDLMRRWGS